MELTLNQLNNEPEKVEKEEEQQDVVRGLSPGRIVLRRFFKSKLTIGGLVVLATLFLFSFLGPVIFNAPDPTITQTGEFYFQSFWVNIEAVSIRVFQRFPESQYGPIHYGNPSSQNWFGTDSSAFDVFSRLMHGGRISLTIGFVSVFISTTLGLILGALSGLIGKWVDHVIMRLADVFSSVPGLPLLLIIGAALNMLEEELGIGNARIFILMGVMAFLGWAGMARLVRGQILMLREQEFMTAAEAMGFSNTRKIVKHLIPNIMPQIIVSMTLGLGGAMLAEASLSFLGIGVLAPTATWGTMVSAVNSLYHLENYPLWWLPAGLMILASVMSFNFVGDGLRDAMDPRARR
ncbi:MAG: ABC transporter permease [Firmicutes bacterium]|nr:ABC transporter permease [Bacillota bacterium]